MYLIGKCVSKNAAWVLFYLWINKLFSLELSFYYHVFGCLD